MCPVWTSTKESAPCSLKMFMVTGVSVWQSGKASVKESPENQVSRCDFPTPFHKPESYNKNASEEILV